MKFLRGLILVSSLLLAACIAPGQEKTASKGYDIGSCSPDSFLAAHVALVEKDLSMDFVSDEPGVVTKIEKPLVYKYQSEDKVGSHYLYETKDGHKLELVLNFEKKFGAFLVDGKPGAVLFLMKDDDGKQLAENAMSEFQACMSLLNSKDDCVIKIQ